MTTVRQIADDYVTRYAAFDPVAATSAGIAGHDAELTDYSPEAARTRADHDRATLAALDAADTSAPRDRIAADVMREQLQASLAAYDAGDHLRELSVLGSPVSGVRDVFDLMPNATADDWSVIADRLAALPQSLATFQAALREGAATGVVASQRQAFACGDQAATWGGLTATTPFFESLVANAPAELPASLRATLTEHADAATATYAALATYLREQYASRADAADGVGRERYARSARRYLGIADLDLGATYAWGWEELDRIEHAMTQVADRIIPGAARREVIDHLETDPNRMVEGEDSLRAFLQDLMDRTIAELNGTQFDIPAPVQTVEAMIAPPGGAAAMYYTPPAEDFSRPGRTWYPTDGRTHFPLWHEVTTAYHEGVPGHHLQVGQVVFLADELTRYQRTFGWTSGHGEGWALYAERLMGELGYLDDPAYELGMLAAQAFRATRVIIDIGMHCEMVIPKGRAHAGETWGADLALGFLLEHAPLLDDAFAQSEINRYLGIPGQAISYKVGERVWLEGRSAARANAGDSFDLKTWHAQALDLGPLGLDQLARELPTLGSVRSTTSS
ncbi:MAG: DUF885 domain-containing protein [Acidimicrobiia bacterium]